MEIDRSYEYLQNINMDMVKRMLPERDESGHKGTFGTLLNISGSRGMHGAAVMSTMSAVRSGVGLVKTVVPEGIYDIVGKQVIESVFVVTKGNELGTISSDSISDILANLQNSTACIVGCGLGWNSDVKKVVYELIRSCEVPLLIDADGINVLSENIDILKEKKSEIVITPHIKEMSRLLDVGTEEVVRNKIKYAKQVAQKYKITVVLKDHNTIISDKDGNIFMNRTGNSGMAKGGSGDVLSGMVGALLAQRIDVLDATICGVYLHGTVGDRCAEKFSKRSMLTTDMINEIPNLFLEIE